MKRFVIWSPILVVAAIVLVAAAPSKKSNNDAVTPVATPTSPEPVAFPIDVNYQDMNVVGPLENAVQPDPTISSSQGGNYSIDWYSINGGGTVNATSTNYKMGASIGQSVAGAAASPSYQMGIGFWYGASSGACACDCHADPACDNATDILDVVQTVNVAFRGAAAILDPNAACPYETTDANCSTATDVIDVVKMVNVAFRGFNPATEFCNPCP